MHSYEVEGQAKVVVALAAASILIVWLIHIVLDVIDFNLQWWLSVPSFAGSYSGLYWLFDRYVWHLGLLRHLNLVQLPNLNGRWVGKVKSSYNQAGGAQSVSVVILQRWSKMLVRLESEHSRSRSITASLRTADLLNPELSYQYVNEPKSNAPGTMQMHRGTVTLELSSSTLKGDYYTGRGRGEVGTIELHKS